MAEIVLCRVDSRLIHGQVVTKWVNQSGANRIIVISDELEKDEFLKSIYIMAAPPNIKVQCYGVQSGSMAWAENEFGSGKVLLIVPDLAVLNAIIDAGIKLKEAQIGGLGGGPERKVVFQNITLDGKDVTVLKKLNDQGLRIYFQTIPEDSPRELKTILAKYE